MVQIYTCPQMKIKCNLFIIINQNSQELMTIVVGKIKRVNSPYRNENPNHLKILDNTLVSKCSNILSHSGDMSHTKGYIKYVRALRDAQFKEYLKLLQRRYPARIRRPSRLALKAECNRAMAASNYFPVTLRT